MYDNYAIILIYHLYQKSFLFIMSITKAIKIQTNSVTPYRIILPSGISHREVAFDLLRSMIVVKV